MLKCQETLNSIVANGDAPFVVAMVADAHGVRWSGAAGDAAPDRSASEDTIFRIFSMTKAIASTAAMMLVDRGKLSLDTPVEDILPDFGKIKVLEGFDGDCPRLREPRIRCTIRNLLTHTSGFVYPVVNADVLKFIGVTQTPDILSGRMASLFYPLIFDPGSNWAYGISIDWLGRAIEAIDGRRIDQFCEEEIFAPLLMKNTIFEVSGDRQIALASVYARLEGGSFTEISFSPTASPEFYPMGGALYSTAPDYMRFLRLFLNDGALDGERLLTSSSVALMRENQIGPMSVSPMTLVIPPVGLTFELLPGIRKTHTMGFMRTEGDAHGMRNRGSLGWCGLLNTHFWIDPKANLAALFMTQLAPLGDPRVMSGFDEFERAVYTHG